MRARKAAVLGALALGAATQGLPADTRQNPYEPIVQRNPFGLKDPPPPVVEGPKEEQKPPPNVKLTGISNLFQKRAFLEVTEQGVVAKPGQPAPAGLVNRPILAESEAAFGVEVLSIDVEKNVVKIRNNGAESELTFEAPKPSGGPVTPGTGTPAYVPPAGGVSAAGGQPTLIGSPNAQTTGGGGVTLYGGGAGTAAQNNAGVTTLGGTSSAPKIDPATGLPSPLGTESGLRTIPSRTIRTPGDQPQVDAAQQAILNQAQQLRQQQQDKYRSRGTPPSPVPPTPQPYQ
jgi:hypothetical protein